MPICQGGDVDGGTTMDNGTTIVQNSWRDGGVRYGICAATPLLYGAIEIYRSHHFVIGGGGEEL